MRLPVVHILFIATICFCNKSNAQQDTVLLALADFPAKYFKEVDKKIDKYSNRIKSKSEKTLTKLSHWENKIKNLLQKANPEAANRLFGPGKTTFSLLLEQLKKGKSIAENQTAEYNDYKDKLSTGIKYLQSKKSLLDSSLIKPLIKVTEKMSNLDETMANTEAVEKFVKERKKQLMDESLKYFGKSKYLSKINKESYYYVETLRNYKELFKDKKKAEETAMKVLNQIPAFKKFVKENSALASLFGSNSGNSVAQNITGLQTRSGINAFMLDKFTAGGPNAQEIFSQNMQMAQNEMNKLKTDLINKGASGGDGELPDFKPHNQRSKTLFQRIEYGSNMQFSKNNSFVPATADLGLSIGYKLNDKSLIGIGASYKMGFGSIQKISFTHQGIGLRSFVDWKIKKQFFFSGGFEMNYNAQFRNMAVIKNFNDWQQAGLIGVTKKMKLKTKLMKSTNLQLLYDFLHNQHIPVSQPIIFRVGYSFK